MQIEVKPVQSKKEMNAFIRFPYKLYRNNPCWIPQLLMQEKAQFDPDINPAFKYCKTEFFVAWRDKSPVGRIAAIVNGRYNDKTGKKSGRFGWFECEHNEETATALLREAEKWLAEQGMDEVCGPMGFTDNDMTGFLIEGFDELPTIAASYNLPWYNTWITSLGYSKEVDYVEFRAVVPETMPDKLERIANIVRRRTDIQVFSPTNKKKLAKYWGHQLFGVLNESFAELHGTSILDDDEIDYFIDAYLGQVDTDFIKLATVDDKLVGFIIAMPSLSTGFQKAKGRLFPFGFIHVLRAMKTADILDFYLAGVLPEYQGKGIDALMAYEMGMSAIARGMKYTESNRELEDNHKIQAQWKLLDKRLHRRTRVYNKRLEN